MFQKANADRFQWWGPLTVVKLSVVEQGHILLLWELAFMAWRWTFTRDLARTFAKVYITLDLLTGRHVTLAVLLHVVLKLLVSLCLALSFLGGPAFLFFFFKVHTLHALFNISGTLPQNSVLLPVFFQVSVKVLYFSDKFFLPQLTFPALSATWTQWYPYQGW